MTAFDPINKPRMENISEHVSYAEATVSATGSRKGIDNTPSPEILATMKITAEKLFEPIRKHFGVPVRIISFFRSAALNKAVGGAKSSQHMTGEAMDLQMTGQFTNRDLWEWLKLAHSAGTIDLCQAIYEFGNDQEPDWVHVSYATTTRTNKGEFLRAIKVNGKTKYIPY